MFSKTPRKYEKPVQARTGRQRALHAAQEKEDVRLPALLHHQSKRHGSDYSETIEELVTEIVCCPRADIPVRSTSF